MADSIITKKAISDSFKKILKEKPFEKISVGEICEDCGLTRKSFYYHFRDKYDLVSWIFRYEFLDEHEQFVGYEMIWFFDDLFRYLFDNKSFYKKLFDSSGQNSFHDTFIESLSPFACGLADVVLPDAKRGITDCLIDFLCEGLAAAVKRGLNSDISGEEFIEATHKSVTETVVFILGCQLEFSNSEE